MTLLAAMAWDSKKMMDGTVGKNVKPACVEPLPAASEYG